MKGVFFSEKVKEELSSLPIEGKKASFSEILGFLKTRGNFDIKKGKFTVSLGNIAAARRFIQLLEYIAGKGKTDFIQVGVRDLDKRHRVTIIVPEGIVNISWKEWSNYETIHKLIGNDVIGFSHFFRGIFLAGGSITNPRKHYHLEIVMFDEEFLQNMKENIMKLLGIKGNVVKLRYSYRLYFKRSGAILELLHFMGAKNSAYEFERVIREKAAKGDTNRSINFITANAVRSGTSIAKQIEAIRKIDEILGIDKLPEDLRKVALARLENEDMSLRELGELLNMSKMMVYNRLKKILKISEDLL
ncbi:MAG: DNA-binding protein WhiA [Thermotogaceae bacterium]|nr:DNA-binding protein WhiA [Thermotogaceae bacterium]